MSTSAGSPGSPYRAKSSAADAYLSRHQDRGPVRAARCTLTIQAAPGQDLDDAAIAAALQRVKLPAGCRLTEDPQVHRGWQEEEE